MKRVFNSTIALLLCISMIFSGAVVAFAADVATPANPALSSISGSNVKISWKAVSDVKGYVVYRSTSSDGGWEDIGKTSGTEYTDEDAENGQVYYYTVRAYKLEKNIFGGNKIDNDRNRIYSDYSATVKAVTDPAQVSGVKSTNTGASSVTLAWNAASGAKGYQVYMLDNATNQYKRVATTSKKTYTVRNLSERTSYKFKVRAYHKLNGVRYGTFSSEFSVTTALADVTNFKLSKSGTTTYTISWDANDRITGFQLARYDNADAEWKIIRFGDKTYTTDTTYSVAGLTNGGYTKYKIRTFIDNKTYGNWSAVVLGGTLPKAPTGLKLAANTDNGVSIAWNAVEGAAGYEVYCCDETGNWRSVGTTDRNSFNHSNLTEKKNYEYKVRAYVGNVDDKMYGNFGEVVKIFYEPLEIPESEYPDDWDQTGILGYLYDPKEKCFYTADDPWQRNFGYSEIYDNAAGLVAIIIETCRLKFEYDDRDWMIQLWKGQYGFVLYGSEIGIYTKDKNMPVEHYNCATDEDMLQMEMVLWERQKTVLGTDAWVRSFGRPYERQWWHTGFVWGNMIGRYDNDLKMEARITMRDFEMLDGFVAALKAEGFDEVTGTWSDLLNKNDNCFRVSNLDVYFYWT